jgi:hypothetical protein
MIPIPGSVMRVNFPHATIGAYVVAGLPHHVCQDFRKQAGTGIMDSYLPPLSACDAVLCRMNSLIHKEPRPQYAKVYDDYLILVGLISGHSDFVPKLTFLNESPA